MRHWKKHARGLKRRWPRLDKAPVRRGLFSRTWDASLATTAVGSETESAAHPIWSAAAAKLMRQLDVPMAARGPITYPCDFAQRYTTNQSQLTLREAAEELYRDGRGRLTLSAGGWPVRILIDSLLLMFQDVTREDCARAMLAVHVFRDTARTADLLSWTYQRSVRTYTARDT